MKTSGTIIILTIIALAAVRTVSAQTVLTTGLQGPTKIVTAGQTHLVVAETGTPAPNSGRISLVERNTGARRTLIDGLPSAFNPVEQTPSGISGLKLVGLKLYVTFGQGDAVRPGPRGSIAANPSPATPLNNSVLELWLPADYEVSAGGFTLGLSNQETLDAGGEVALQNQEGKILNVRLVADLPDYKMERRPQFPQGNVRPANLFGVEWANGHLFVVDASFNQLYKVDPVTGAYQTLAVFPPRPNPLPFGPPVSEAVPDNIRFYDGKLLVSFLTGFPFAPGNAEIRAVDPETGAHQQTIGGLTSAMDVLPVPVAGLDDIFYVLEFSANMLGDPAPPGRLKLFANGEEPTVLVSNLISPTSMARDGASGDLFITEIFTGRIIRVPGTFDPNTQFGGKR
jgi:hypothetical protein